MDFKILIDDRSEKDGIDEEHGLSIYIKTNGRRILFDSGASKKFVQNAAKMDVDLKKIDYAVASHGHYDHTGGFPEFCEINHKARLYIHKNAFRRSYVWRDGAFGSVISGIRWTEEEEKELEKRIIYTDEPTEIAENIWISGSIKMGRDFTFTEKFYYKDETGNMVEDDMSHEQCLIVKEDKGIYIFSGCSHRGASSAVKTGKSLFPGEKVLLFAGGMHLVRATEEEMIKTADMLYEEDIENVMPLHCTGRRGAEIIREKMGEKCVFAAAGDCFYGC